MGSTFDPSTQSLTFRSCLASLIHDPFVSKLCNLLFPGSSHSLIVGRNLLFVQHARSGKAIEDRLHALCCHTQSSNTALIASENLTQYTRVAHFHAKKEEIYSLIPTRGNRIQPMYS